MESENRGRGKKGLGLVFSVFLMAFVITVSLPAEAASACTLSITPNKPNFAAGESWTVNLNGCPINAQVQMCTSYPSPSGASCTPMGTTDGGGTWSKSGNFSSSDAGAWIEYARVGSATTNDIAFIVKSTSTPTACQGTEVILQELGVAKTVTASSNNTAAKIFTFILNGWDTAGTRAYLSVNNVQYTWVEGNTYLIEGVFFYLTSVDVVYTGTQEANGTVKICMQQSQPQPPATCTLSISPSSLVFTSQGEKKNISVSGVQGNALYSWTSNPNVASPISTTRSTIAFATITVVANAPSGNATIIIEDSEVPGCSKTALVTVQAPAPVPTACEWWCGIYAAAYQIINGKGWATVCSGLSSYCGGCQLCNAEDVAGGQAGVLSNAGSGTNNAAATFMLYDPAIVSTGGNTMQVTLVWYKSVFSSGPDESYYIYRQDGSGQFNVVSGKLIYGQIPGDKFVDNGLRKDIEYTYYVKAYWAPPAFSGLSPKNANSNTVKAKWTETLGTLYLKAAQGYDSKTGQYNNYDAYAGKYLILWGNFPASGNEVYVNGARQEVKYQSTNQLNVLLSFDVVTGVTGVQVPVYVRNSGVNSNTLNFYVNPSPGGARMLDDGGGSTPLVCDGECTSINATKSSCSNVLGTYNIHVVSTENNFYLCVRSSAGSSCTTFTSSSEPVTTSAGKDYPTGNWVTDNMVFELRNASDSSLMKNVSVGITGCGVVSPPAERPRIDAIKGYNPVTGILTSNEAVDGTYLIIDGKFAKSGNQVLIRREGVTTPNVYTPITQAENKIEMQLPQNLYSSSMSNVFNVSINNSNGVSNEVKVTIKPPMTRSCKDNCGSQNRVVDCWCDSNCQNIGRNDCCPDYAQFCGGAACHLSISTPRSSSPPFFVGEQWTLNLTGCPKDTSVLIYTKIPGNSFFTPAFLMGQTNGEGKWSWSSAPGTFESLDMGSWSKNAKVGNADSNTITYEVQPATTPPPSCNLPISNLSLSFASPNSPGQQLGVSGASSSGATVSWSNSNPSVATVSISTGASTTVTPRGAGTATITASVSASCFNRTSVMVNAAPTTCTLSLSSMSLFFTGPDQSSPISASGAKGGVSWSSDNLPVATINSSTGGSIRITTISSSGTATITATDQGVAGCSKTVAVTINNPTAPITCTLSISPSKTTFTTPEAWTVNLNGCTANAQVQICTTQPSASCTSMGTTDIQGRWSRSGAFSDSDAGTWTEYAIVGSARMNDINFIVQRSTAPTACTLSISPAKTTFTTPEAWTVNLNGCTANAQVQICIRQPSASCTPMGTTDVSGHWSKSGTFSSSDNGTWTEYAIVGSQATSDISFTVSSAAAPPACTLSISPSNLSLRPGESSRLTASNAIAPVSWHTNIPSVAVLTPVQGTTTSVTVTGMTLNGNATITATDASGCSVRVSVSNFIPASLSCSPFTQTIRPGQYAVLNVVGGVPPYLWSGGGNPASGSGSTFSTSFSAAGNYPVTLRDSLGGAFSCIVQVQIPPPCSGGASDLTVTDFHLTDASGTTKTSFAAGGRIYPSVTIRNNGPNAACGSAAYGSYFYISIYSNQPSQLTPPAGSDINVWAYEPGAIAPGESKTYSVTASSVQWTNDPLGGGFQANSWTKSAGSYTARAFVDSYNMVSETNEGNNQATGPYAVLP